jgi:hypothetical protein
MLLQAEKTFPNLDIKVVYRLNKDGELKDNDEDFLLNQLKNANFYALDNLHAKCYLNEFTAIITSMNLYQHSQVNNWEMGIKIEKSTDPDTNNVPAHANYTSTKLGQANNVKITYTGYCIRCGKNIVFDLEKPLCPTCFKSWSKYMDDLYQENYCHACGKEHETSLSKPLCVYCYRQLNLH